jgi:hypothetical protein
MLHEWNVRKEMTETTLLLFVFCSFNVPVAFPVAFFLAKNGLKIVKL